MFNLFKRKPYVHQYLDLPVLPEIDLFKLFPDNPDKPNHVAVDPNDVNKEFRDFLESIPGLRINFWEAFYTPPGGSIYIHADQSELSDITRLNYTWGPDDSELIWWEPKKGFKPEPIETFHGEAYLRAEPEQCNRIHSAVINKPSLIQAGTLHSTYNPGPTGRWTLALLLLESGSTDYINFELAVAMFADYLSK